MRSPRPTWTKFLEVADTLRDMHKRMATPHACNMNESRFDGQAQAYLFSAQRIEAQVPLTMLKRWRKKKSGALVHFLPR